MFCPRRFPANIAKLSHNIPTILDEDSKKAIIGAETELEPCVHPYDWPYHVSIQDTLRKDSGRIEGQSIIHTYIYIYRS